MNTSARILVPPGRTQDRREDRREGTHASFAPAGRADRRMRAPAWVAFAALSIIWGMPYLFIKIALGGVAPLAVAWWELTIGAVVLLPLAAIRGELANLGPHWRAIVA